MTNDLDHDLRDTFRRHEHDVLGHGPTPSPSLFRRIRRRQTGTVLMAAVAAAAIAIAGISGLDAIRASEQTPAVPGPAETGPTALEPTVTGPLTGPPFSIAQTPGATPWDVTEEDIALGQSFMDALIEGDGEAAAAMFSPEGTFDGFQPGILPALQDWFRAGGWTFGGGRCGRWSAEAYDEPEPHLGYVGCGFAYENDLTRALEMAPVGGSESRGGNLSIFIDGGKIQIATIQVTEWHSVVSDPPGAGYFFPVDNMFRSPNPARLDLFGTVWDMFIEWVSSSHPEDFGRMYDTDRGYPILDAQSIELWERYTDEFVASPQAAAESFAEWMADQSLDAQAGRICTIATDEFRETVRADNLGQRDPEFYSTLARISEETLAELRALPLETEADRATMDAFVPRAERMIEIHRQQAEAAAAGDHKRLNELGPSLMDPFTPCPGW
jgi:hypothetical protein